MMTCKIIIFPDFTCFEFSDGTEIFIDDEGIVED